MIPAFSIMRTAVRTGTTGWCTNPFGTTVVDEVTIPLRLEVHGRTLQPAQDRQSPASAFATSTCRDATTMAWRRRTPLRVATKPKMMALMLRLTDRTALWVASGLFLPTGLIALTGMIMTVVARNDLMLEDAAR
jgi:hypothetical protein